MVELELVVVEVELVVVELGVGVGVVDPFPLQAYNSLAASEGRSGAFFLSIRKTILRSTL